MKPLPAGLAEPLRLLEPINWRGWAIAGLAALLTAAVAFLLYRRRRRGRPAVEPEPRRAPPPRSAAASIAAAIEAIRQRYSLDGRSRAGCHELSAALRAHLERGTEHPYSALTAREIGRRLGDSPLTRLFALLSDLQFGRREPGKGDLEGICDLTLEVVSTSAGGGR